MDVAVRIVETELILLINARVLKTSCGDVLVLVHAAAAAQALLSSHVFRSLCSQNIRHLLLFLELQAQIVQI